MSKFNRRDFLKLATATGGSALAWSSAQAFLDPKPALAFDGHLTTSAQDVIVPSVCLLCPSGCGMLARVADGRVVKLEGSPMHPINLGALCPKGQAAPELLYNPDRLTNGREVGDRENGSRSLGMRQHR